MDHFSTEVETVAAVTTHSLTSSCGRWRAYLMETGRNQQHNEVQRVTPAWWKALVEATMPHDWAALWLCVPLIVYTTRKKRKEIKLADSIFNCNVAENVFVKRAELKKYIKNNSKSMYCLQQPVAEVQVCCWKGKHTFAKVSAVVQSWNASFAETGQGWQGQNFLIY